jgi:hypothetical protein
MSPTAAIAALPNPDQAKQIMAAWEHLKRTTLQARMHKLGITRQYYEKWGEHNNPYRRWKGEM